MKRLFDYINIKTRLLLGIIYIIIYYKGDVWKLKIQYSNFKNKKYLIDVWYFYFNRYGSWIGHDAMIKSKPCFPHGCLGIFISGGL